jgi:hypothetical protein
MHALKFGEGEVTEKLNPARDQEVEPEGPAVSGLETAIRNALERSERGDKEVRSRIYQSARQALDAGLRKQGVTDQLVIMQQRKRLEDKIREIEDEEAAKVSEGPAVSSSLDVRPEPMGQAGWTAAVTPAAPSAAAAAAQPIAPPIAPPVSQPSSQGSGPTGPAPSAYDGEDHMVAVDVPGGGRSDHADVGAPGALGGVTRSPTADAGGAVPEVGLDRPQRSVTEAPTLLELQPKGRKARKAAKAEAALDVPAERAAKPRRRRSFLSHLMTWMITLAVVAVGCWLFYRSGMVQSVVDEAMQAADRANTVQPSGQGPSALASRGGFSEDWAPIFEPAEAAAFTAGPQAQAEIATAPEGQALKLASATPEADGNVVIEVPADILRELAGRSSTLAVTIQSAVNEPAQLSVQCDFGSLGTCRRHRFTATQEKLDALFRVTFDHTLAPSSPGRLILNAGGGGAERPILIYSVRALPGQ